MNPFALSPIAVLLFVAGIVVDCTCLRLVLALLALRGKAGILAIVACLVLCLGVATAGPGLDGGAKPSWELNGIHWIPARVGPMAKQCECDTYASRRGSAEGARNWRIHLRRFIPWPRLPRRLQSPRLRRDMGREGSVEICCDVRA